MKIFRCTFYLFTLLHNFLRASFDLPLTEFAVKTIIKIFSSSLDKNCFLRKEALFCKSRMEFVMGQEFILILEDKRTWSCWPSNKAIGRRSFEMGLMWLKMLREKPKSIFFSAWNECLLDCTTIFVFFFSTIVEVMKFFFSQFCTKEKYFLSAIWN